MIYKNKKNKGFTLVEVLIACTIISVSTFALMQASSTGIRLSNQALIKLQANLLIEEGVESVKSMRDDSWSNISNLTQNVLYYLSFNNNLKKWELSTTETSIDNNFTRSIVVEDVYRDINDDIVNNGGIIDPRTRKITVKVSWPFSGAQSSKELSFYIADIFN